MSRPQVTRKGTLVDVASGGQNPVLVIATQLLNNGQDAAALKVLRQYYSTFKNSMSEEDKNRTQKLIASILVQSAQSTSTTAGGSGISANLEGVLTKLAESMDALVKSTSAASSGGGGGGGARGRKDPDDTTSPSPEPVPAKNLVDFSDVIGAKREKTQILRDFVFPLQFPGMLDSGKALLMYGPPGTGKTFMAKAITSAFSNTLLTKAEREADKQIVFLFAGSGAELKGKFVGETEKNIKTYFNTAQQAALDAKDPRAKSILFLDEIEAIALDRAEGGAIGTASVNALLQAMDGVQNFDRVIVLAATNLPWKLDSAIMSRFSTKLFTDLPTDSARAELIRRITDDKLLTTDNDRERWPDAKTRRAEVAKRRRQITKYDEFIKLLTVMTGVKGQIKGGYDQKTEDFFRSTDRTAGGDAAVHSVGFSMREIDRIMDKAFNALALQVLQTRVQASDDGGCYHVKPDVCTLKEGDFATASELVDKKIECRLCESSASERKTLRLKPEHFNKLAARNWDLFQKAFKEGVPATTTDVYEDYVNYHQGRPLSFEEEDDE